MIVQNDMDMHHSLYFTIFMRKHTDRHSIRPENPKYFLCDVTIGGENKKKHSSPSFQEMFVLNVTGPWDSLKRMIQYLHICHLQTKQESILHVLKANNDGSVFLKRG